MLRAMFTSEMRPGAVDESGAYLCDRDAFMFSCVLRHLQGDDSFFLELSTAGLSKLRFEADYFALTSLMVKTGHAISRSMEAERSRMANEREMEILKARLQQAEAENARIYKNKGCVVERSKAAVGERVVMCAQLRSEDFDCRRKRLSEVGTIISTEEDRGSEMGVKWDDGTVSHNHSGGKRNRYDLEYA
jgi:hypothetical protein